jgi:hypothetical protein
MDAQSQKPFKILVAGGCYAGLTAVVTIVEKCDNAVPPIPVNITIVDERDGFCKLARAIRPQ